MPLSTTAKAVLCLCPPAVMAGTVATVPPVKRAVHHLTAPHHAPAKRIAANDAVRPKAATAAQVDCNPVGPAGLPAIPLVTYAAPIPDEPGGGSAASGGTGPGTGVIGALAGGGGGSGVAPLVSPIPDVTGAVPEPATWLMLIAGMGTVGAALRRRRGRSPRVRAKSLAGATLWSGGMAAEAGEVAATVAVRSTVAAKSTAAGIAAKALLCACPAAVLAGGVMAVPPLRQAVHAATIPPEPTSPLEAAAGPITPCTGAAAVPVATAATPELDGFPASVQTTPTT